jgi:two-component system LytT family sensor kinase
MKAFKPVTIIILLCFLVFSLFTAEKPMQYSTAVKIKLTRISQKDTAAVNEFVRKGIKYLSSKPQMIDEAKACIDSATAICEKKKIEIPARLNWLNAEYYYVSGDLTNVPDECEKALQKSIESKDFEILAKTHILLGGYYHRTGFYRESIENYESAIEVAKKEGLKKIIPTTYYRQSQVYRTVGDTKNYLQNLELMIDAGLAENDSSYPQTGLHILGTYFCGDTTTSERRNFKLADSLLRESLKISMPMKDTSSVVLSLANIGWNYYLEMMYDSAIYYYNQSLKYSLPANLSSPAANSLGNLGTIYRDLRQKEVALKYYQQGIEQAKKDNDLYDLWWIYRDMSDLYLMSRDTANAFRNYVLFKKYSDIYNSKASIQGLQDAQIRYEADTHKKELELLSLRLKNNRLLNYGFAGLTLLILSIGYLIYRGSKLKDKRRISEMNRKISEITQANLRQQINPHFIFNTLNSIQYYMYQHDKLATNNYLTKFSSLMRKVLENSQHTSVPLSDELSALNLYLELESIRFKDKFEYSINVDEDIDPLLHRIPTMLIQPYVENSICHGLIAKEAKGYVNIDLKLNSEYILCTIEDNGIGREAAKERNLKREENHNSLGTRITKSRIDLVNELYGTSLQTVYTDLKDENGESSGTRVEIHIPIIA